MHGHHFRRAAHPGVTRRVLLPFLRTALLHLAVLSSAHAEEARTSPQVWINPGFVSWHFDRGKDFREDNWGVGVEVVLVPEHAVMAGTFINSDGEHTRYVAYQWRPLRWRPYGVDVSAGIALGAFDGYPRVNDGGWFAAPLPLLAVEGRYFGVNFTVVPTIQDKVHGAFVIQIKLRVW
jgi:hypothetical protein